MKKTLIAVAALAATGAFAQVSLYGRLDVGYANYTTTDAAGVETKSNGVQSKGSVSSLWGIKGSEDLGGGLKANIKLETNVDPATGNSTATYFDRTSTVGLSGGFGSVDFGRDYTPMFSLIASTDLFGLSNITTVGMATAGGGSSLPNQIIYRSPVMNGLSANVSYNNTDTTSGTTDAKVTGNTITVSYANGPLMVGIGAGNQETTAGATVTKTEGQTLVASYDFGSFKIVGNTIKSKAVATGVESKENNLGVSAPMGKATLKAMIGNNDNGAAANNTGNDFVVGVDYALSKATSLYAATGTYNKFGDNAKKTGTAVGIKTTF